MSTYSGNILVLLNKTETTVNAETFSKSIENENNIVTLKCDTELTKATYDSPKFDVIFYGFLGNQALNSDKKDSVLEILHKVLKPSGKLLISKGDSSESNNETSLISNLKLSGFININFETIKVGKDYNVVISQKPNYEVGSSAKLNLSKKVATVWKLDDDDEEAETIDPDNLLDDDDLKKPDASSLRVCNTTGKRKACKDCSCGLAEELEDETKGVAVKSAGVDLPKSSCGSCYLGDAFRCAACPYLGMPAFKPGEKILLSDTQMKADV